jgi:hypothetical protein
MVLNARVVAIESGDCFNDGIRRVTFQFLDADSMWSKVRIPLTQKLFGIRQPELDDIVVFQSQGVLAEEEKPR